MVFLWCYLCLFLSLSFSLIARGLKGIGRGKKWDLCVCNALERSSNVANVFARNVSLYIRRYSLCWEKWSPGISPSATANSVFSNWGQQTLRSFDTFAWPYDLPEIKRKFHLNWNQWRRKWLIYSDEKFSILISVEQIAWKIESYYYHINFNNIEKIM